MKHKVLVVDDDRLVADTLQMVFLSNGFESEACYSVGDALRRAKTFDPELMLCDVTMPGQDGLELAATITREMPATRVIMLTAYLTKAASVQLEALRRRRPLKLITKPCHPEVLLREVEESLALAPLPVAS